MIKIFPIKSGTYETASMITLKGLMKETSFQVIYTCFFNTSIHKKAY